MPAALMFALAHMHWLQSSQPRRMSPQRLSDSRQLPVPVRWCQVTVSTVGLVPEMQRFTASCRAQLAVSLHATTDEVWACTWGHPIACRLHVNAYAQLFAVPSFCRADSRRPTAQQCQPQHGGCAQVRDWLCPVNRRWPLAVLLGALVRDYPRRPNGAASRHFVLIEYVMLSGVNDTLDNAHRSAPTCHETSMTRNDACTTTDVNPVQAGHLLLGGLLTWQ